MRQNMPRALFGSFEFDCATLELRRDGVPVRLQTQPAQVLKTLVEKPDQIVSREQLRQAVWGESTFVDFESGLNFCISQLRSILRDDASQPLFIRTVPRRGYQFIAPVRVLEAEDRQAPSVKVESRAPRRKFALGAAIAAGLLLAILVGLAIHRRMGSVHAATPIVGVIRFDNETGNPALNAFASNVTDELVGQLANRGDGLYRVAGNAKVLFAPREQRDLRSIASALNASYIVLGQVQSSGDRVRVLAHLIRASDQTHIWVVRVERPASDMPQLDGEIAEQVAEAFNRRLASHPDRAPSFSAGNH